MVTLHRLLMMIVYEEVAAKAGGRVVVNYAATIDMGSVIFSILIVIVIIIITIIITIIIVIIITITLATTISTAITEKFNKKS